MLDTKTARPRARTTAPESREDQATRAIMTHRRIRLPFNRFLRILGPGVITGAADDDPSGIATYTQTGAQFGFGQLWTALFMLPFQPAVQEACARIGAVTGKGIAAIVKEHYNRRILYAVVTLLLVANTVNIGADLGAMGGAAALVIPLPAILLTITFTGSILVLEVFTSYVAYARVLKLLALSLGAYVLTVAILHLQWHTILKATFVPHIEPSFAFLFIITGVLGTTISPYMFFWQASQEVEEESVQRLTHGEESGAFRQFLRTIRIDTVLGMVSSEAATWCIIVVGAAVLNANGITNVATAADAAKALEPLVQTFPHAGYLAKMIFATGVIASDCSPCRSSPARLHTPCARRSTGRRA